MKKDKREIRFHHACIICTDEWKAREFYVGGLGMEIHRESFSTNKNAKKLELYFQGQYIIELFIKEDAGRPKAEEKLHTGLEHLAFCIENVEEMLLSLADKGILVTQIKIDGDTGKKYGFCFDPDGTKIEFYEI